jgi:plastocyanin
MDSIEKRVISMKGLLVCLLLALLVFGCAQSQQTQQAAAPSPAPASGPSPSSQPDQGAVSPSSPAAPSSTAATVEIKSFAFSPATLEISTGTTVTWKNSDAVPHTATGNGGEFDTGTIQSGGEGSHLFDKPGTYAYHCSFHSSMTATITVN